MSINLSHSVYNSLNLIEIKRITQRAFGDTWGGFNIQKNRKKQHQRKRAKKNEKCIKQMCTRFMFVWQFVLPNQCWLSEHLNGIVTPYQSVMRCNRSTHEHIVRWMTISFCAVILCTNGVTNKQRSRLCRLATVYLCDKEKRNAYANKQISI